MQSEADRLKGVSPIWRHNYTCPQLFGDGNDILWYVTTRIHKNRTSLGLLIRYIEVVAYADQNYIFPLPLQKKGII